MSRVPPPLKTKTFARFSKCQPKQHEEQNIECHFHEVKWLGQQQMHPLALTDAHYVSSQSTRDQERTKPELSGLWKKNHLLSLADSAGEKGSQRLPESSLKMPVPSQNEKRGRTMVAAEGAAGPGGTRLSLSIHVINSCPHSKHFLKGCLSVFIYL